jgi:hypothetical protein
MLVNIVPSYPAVETQMAVNFVELRLEIRDTICRLTLVPEYDVLVNLMKCPYANPDPGSANAVVYMETTYKSHLKRTLLGFFGRILSDVGLRDYVNADMVTAIALNRAISQIFVEKGLTGNKGIEFWNQYTIGPWSLVREGFIEDSTYQDAFQL